LAEIVIRVVLNIIYDSFGNSAYILDQLCFLTAVISGTTCLMELLQVRKITISAKFGSICHSDFLDKD
jgi:hypothetical protein